MSQQKLYPVASKAPPYAIHVSGVEKRTGEGIPRRHPGCGDDDGGLKSSPDESISCTYDIVRFAARTYGDAPCMGSRKLIKTHVEKKMIPKIVNGEQTEVEKQWVFYEFGPFEFISFVQYKKRVDAVGAGLLNLGLKKGDLVHVFAATSKQWLAMAHGTASQSMAIVTAYDTLGEVGLTHSLTEAKSKAIFLDFSLIRGLLNPLKSAKEVRYVIYNTENIEFDQADLQALTTAFPHLVTISFDDLVKLGTEHPAKPTPADREDLCCVMYTSGSTGNPKGVCLSHKNIVAATTGACAVFRPYCRVGDYILNFLPLAHIFEFVFENAVLVGGAAMGYGNPRTISDRAMRNCKGDMRELRPMLLIGVPAVWETVKKGIVEEVRKLSSPKQAFFWGAMALKSLLLQTGVPGVNALDAIVFSKIKELTGGRMRACMVGGGPISRETHYFISNTICPMIVGYGLTETSAMGTLMHPSEWSNTSIGGPTTSVEIKLVDFPEAGYFTSNIPEQGEIWIRGPAISLGYFNNPEETTAAFEDGWFKTGDIGEWDTVGHLKIIDRKKNLVKSLAGEYIALEKLEAIYRSDSTVVNIMVYADANQNKPVAVVVPNETVVVEIAKKNGINDGEHLSQLIHNRQLSNIILERLLTTGRNGGLVGIELLQSIILTDYEWTPQSGLVTSAMKLNRREIVKKHRVEIDAAYGIVA